MRRRTKRLIALAVVFLLMLVGWGYLSYLSVEAEANGEEFVPSHILWRVYLATRLISPNDVSGGVPCVVSLMDEAERHPIESTQVFLDYGADINLQGDLGDGTGRPRSGSALMSAVLLRYLEGVEFLLKHGAKPNLERDDGATALSFLNGDKSDEKANLRIAQLLIEAGADPCHRDHQGQPTWHDFKEGDPVRVFLEAQCRAKAGG